MADQNLQQATLGGGCFGVQHPCGSSRVVEVLPAAGGDVENQVYELVCTGTTNHAEVVQIPLIESFVCRTSSVSECMIRPPNRQG